MITRDEDGSSSCVISCSTGGAKTIIGSAFVYYEDIVGSDGSSTSIRGDPPLLIGEGAGDEC